MNYTRIYAIALRYFILLRGHFTRLFQLFVWALLDIVLWGFISRYLDSVGSATFSFVPVLLGAVLLWDFVARAQQGVSMPFLEDIWSHNLLNYFASPLSIGEYVVGLVAVSVITSALGLVGMLVLAYFFFNFSVFIFGLPLIAFFLILFLFGTTLGIVGAAIILRYGPSAEWFTWPIPAVLSPFVGVFYPVSVLPEWMQWVGKALPPTYVFTNLRSIIGGKGFSNTDLLLGSVLAVILLVLAWLLFVRVYRHAVRSGAIARYSAESYS